MFPTENGFGSIWSYEKRAEDETAARSARTPLGTMRFGKRGTVPLGTMRFGKRSELENFLDALVPVHPNGDRVDSNSGYVDNFYGKTVYLGPSGKRNSPLGTMRFGK
ncbi:unnamed protein product [Gongylonema pulchrum]|uniref:Esterase n=1 Tax=Gongylonema pulchrum TaxID=637853 RepID=A0A183CW89_9BILA|nr:unnamed protein product [Gongylonema pulchrum]